MSCAFISIPSPGVNRVVIEYRQLESPTTECFEPNEDQSQQGMQHIMHSTGDDRTEVANFSMKTPLKTEHGMVELLYETDGLNDDMEGVWEFFGVRGEQSNTLATYIESNELRA